MIKKTKVSQDIFHSSIELQEWAAQFAAQLSAGDVLILSGSLGAGKTTFTQGLARGIGIKEPISSPTFTLSHLYPAQAAQCGLVHIDIYRLLDSAPHSDDLSAYERYFGFHIDSLDIEEYMQDCIIVIEWGENLAQIFTDRWWEIAITVQADFSREVTVQRVVEDGKLRDSAH